MDLYSNPVSGCLRPPASSEAPRAPSYLSGGQQFLRSRPVRGVRLGGGSRIIAPGWPGDDRQSEDDPQTLHELEISEMSQTGEERCAKEAQGGEQVPSFLPRYIRARGGEGEGEADRRDCSVYILSF